ncbi:MAG TPA: 4Fe-4S dicluster domain-containing protein [Candidatus Cloacimonadota bacterium]|nr:4Fe-4S dicluster domain-containing protein [Candidatus Cloacimonadota bacterium]HPT71305.1 4Fe-4S dicluster domain-containing protein [Candidatus Cloacimonadota bacterium]
MKRKIIKIDPDKCNGCGLCIPNCPEGAIQIIDQKARLVSDLACDGLGACLGHCPQGAITIEEREAEPYDEKMVMVNIVKQGANTIKAHLKHLHDHQQHTFLNEAIQYLQENHIEIPEYKEHHHDHHEETVSSCGCAGSAARSFSHHEHHHGEPAMAIQSELRQWPVQLHLINPDAGYFANSDLLISADCVPYAYGDYHRKFLKGKIVITLCPKLDRDIDSYVDKLAEIFTKHNIKSLSIVRMEVPCCGGTEYIVQKALERSGKMHFVKLSIVSMQGDIL